MAEWVEIPAHRVLMVNYTEFHEHYSQVDDKGEPCQPHNVPYRIVRLADDKVFKVARFGPTCGVALNVLYLEEV